MAVTTRLEPKWVAVYGSVVFHRLRAPNPNRPDRYTGCGIRLPGPPDCYEAVTLHESDRSCQRHGCR